MGKIWGLLVDDDMLAEYLPAGSSRVANEGAESLRSSGLWRADDDSVEQDNWYSYYVFRPGCLTSGFSGANRMLPTLEW